MTRIQWLAASAASFCLAAALPATAQEGGFIQTQFRVSQSETAAAPTPAQETVAAGAALGERLAARGDAARFYAQRDGAPAWVERGRLNDAARELLDALQGAGEHGLDPDAYHLAALAQAVDGRGRVAGGYDADVDALLTDAFLLYADHLLNGRIDPAITGDNVEGGDDARDLVADLASALSRGGVQDTLEALAPQHPQYRLLQEAYLTYARAAAESSWPKIDTGDTLKPGMRDPRVPQIRARLDAEDAFAGRAAPRARTLAAPPSDAAAPEHAPDPLLYDAALEARIEAFQREHGLAVDGAVGPNTLAMLNQGPAERAEAIQLNMERWRWLPHELGERYILVNTPQYRLHAYEDGREALSMKVIVGQETRETPQFSDRIEYLVVNPNWNVPYNIATQDKLPKLRSDPGYFDRLGYSIYTESGQRVSPYDVNWSNYSRGNFPFRLVQRPGPDNALGTIKFIFPNAYNVYLHDTNDPDLFAEDARSLSSGCIRVSDPRGLARWIADADPQADMAEVQAAWDSGRTETLYLGQQVPVHVTYFTAWVGDDGDAEFYGDLYGRDRALRAALSGAS